jgi:formate hydrogenlyase subunit 4
MSLTDRLLQLTLLALTLAFVAPLLPGVIAKVKAAIAGRRGPPLVQLHRDLAKLWKKDMVRSETTSWVFSAGPAVTLVATLFAALIVPIGPGPAPLAFEGDLILFVYLLALGRFFTTSAALDTGSAFEGMGAARDLTFAALAEVALLFGLLAASAHAGSRSLSTLLPTFDAATSTAPLLLVSAAFAIVLLTESARVPVDDPNTHLELTMVHEVMVLDHSGPALGLVLYGAALKLLVLAALIAHLLLPPLTSQLGWLALLPTLLGLAALIGLLESVTARLRLSHVPAFLVAAALLSGFGFLLEVT